MKIIAGIVAIFSSFLLGYNSDKIENTPIYETMYEKFSKEERFKKSADFMENLKRETEMQRLIEEEILNEIVYVK